VCDIGGLFALLGTQAVRPEGGAGGGVAVEVDDEDEEGYGCRDRDEIEARVGTRWLAFVCDRQRGTGQVIEICANG
jgi:hypothetical protein